MAPNLIVIFIVWIVGFGILSLKLKEKIAKIFLGSKLPRLVNYCIIIMPLVLIEEFLTCEIGFLLCVAFIVPAFYLFFLILYFIQKTAKLDYFRAAVVFAVMGWVNEFLIVGRLFYYDLFTNIVAGIFALLIYGVLAIVPSYYLQKSLENSK